MCVYALNEPFIWASYPDSACSWGKPCDGRNCKAGKTERRVYRELSSNKQLRPGPQKLTNHCRLYGGKNGVSAPDCARCKRIRRSAPHFESSASNYDACVKIRMPRAHGVHARAGVARVSNRRMLASTKKRNRKRLGRLRRMENATMADIRTAIATSDFAFTTTPATTRPPFWQKLLAAMMASRERQAEREIARYLRDHGGKITCLLYTSDAA